MGVQGIYVLDVVGKRYWLHGMDYLNIEAQSSGYSSLMLLTNVFVLVSHRLKWRPARDIKFVPTSPRIISTFSSATYRTLLSSTLEHVSTIVICIRYDGKSDGQDMVEALVPAPCQVVYSHLRHPEFTGFAFHVPSGDNS